MSSTKLPTVNGDDLYLWTEDGITRVEVIVDDRSMISVWTTGRTPRLVFEVYDSSVHDLIAELRVARERYFAAQLERAPVEVYNAERTGVLTACQGYVQLRRYLPDETLQMYPDAANRDGLVMLKAPTNGDRDWHERQVRQWPVWKREVYMRLLDALRAEEAAARVAELLKEDE